MAPVSMTLSELQARFQDHDIIQRQKTRKWYKIDLYLQWPTNRKSHMVYRTAPFLMTFEGFQTQISRHSLTLNISKMATDTAIVTMENE